jgi:hypothetical protein
MVDSVDSVSSTESTSETSSSSEGGSGGGGPEEINGSTIIRSLAELKEKAPEVYQKMLEGMASNMCQEMKRNQDRIKKIMREYYS